jgi:hypothetical protein
MDGFLLSANTAEKLSELIAQTPGGAVGHKGGAPSRQVSHVIVLAEEGGEYLGKATSYNTDIENWIIYNDEIVIREPNQEKLTVGRRYLAVRSGLIDDLYFFVTQAVNSEDTNNNPGSSSGSSSGSSGSGSGAGLCVLTDVYCEAGSLMGVAQQLTGTVTIGGVSYPVTFSLGECPA